MVIVTHLILIGFPGSGKTTIGAQIASALHFPFVDLDVELAAQHHQSVPKIFATFGEAQFRAMESAVFCECVARRNAHVIATGGGTWCAPESRACAATHLIVQLHVSANVAWHRLHTRITQGLQPPFTPASTFDAFQMLWEKRAPLYASAPHAIDATQNSPEEITQQLVQLYTRHGA